ncbi:MAG TPA: hypothetical protein VL171_13940 [Verrucomicrobiae bacterium]|nr:hypothetical protein [Verrucomicrobiae bacterium]
MNVSNGTISVGNGGALTDGNGFGQLIVSNASLTTKGVLLGSSVGGHGIANIQPGGAIHIPNAQQGCAACGFSSNEGDLDGGVIDSPGADLFLGQTHPGEFFVNSGSGVFSNVHVGFDNIGTVTGFGGSLQALGYISVGEQSGATGFVWMSGGIVVATNNDTNIGGNGYGHVAISNGTVVASHEWVGTFAGSSGTLRLAGGTNIVQGYLEVGGYPNATGAVWMTSGQLATSGQFLIGDGGVGQMTVSNGIELATDIFVGAGSEGTFTMAGGTNTVSSFFTLAGGFNATGTVWMTGGQLDVDQGITVGQYDAGRMMVSNGIIHADREFVGLSLGSQGSLTLQGGVDNVFTLMSIGASGCLSSTGVVNVTGGSLYVTNASVSATLEVVSGTFTASSGFVQLDKLVVTSACARVVHAGGTLLYNTLVLDPSLSAVGDGIPNGFKQQYGLDPFDPNLGSESFNDTGLTVIQAFQSGFAPKNNAAYPHVTGIGKVNANDIKVIYLGANGDSSYTPGIASRTNVLEFSPGTANGSYSNNFTSTGQTNILSGGTGVGLITNMIDAGGATNPSRYYRIRVITP